MRAAHLRKHRRAGACSRRWIYIVDPHRRRRSSQHSGGTKAPPYIEYCTSCGDLDIPCREARRAVDDRPYKRDAPKDLSSRGPAGPWRSPGTILRPHRHRCRSDTLPGDSHGRHSRPRNDIFLHGRIDFYISCREAFGRSMTAPAKESSIVRTGVPDGPAAQQRYPPRGRV